MSVKSNVLIRVAVFFFIFTFCTPLSHSNEETVDNQGSAKESVSGDDEEARVRNGGEIFKKMNEQNPMPGHNPMVRGQMTKVPVLTLFITQKMWNELSKKQQIDYSYYVESLIPSVRNNPEQYVLIPKSAPLYDMFVDKTRNLCDDCWAIGILVPKGGELIYEEAAVQGDTPWNADDECCRGMKSSEFRK